MAWTSCGLASRAQPSTFRFNNQINILDSRGVLQVDTVLWSTQIKSSVSKINLSSIMLRVVVYVTSVLLVNGERNNWWGIIQVCKLSIADVSVF